VEKHLIRQAPYRLKGRTIRIYKGYEPEWLKDIKPVDRKDIDVPDDAILIGCVANVRKIKGIPYLVKAADLLPDNLPVYFLLTGLGMDSAPMKTLISRSKYRNNFRIKGYSSDVLSYTSACDIYIQPSLNEGLGRSVIEAMCLGKPVIASGTGGVEELIDEGINGYHVPAKSPAALAEKILLCYQNRAGLPEMGERGKERIRTVFSSGRMIEETYQLFRSMVSLQ
jgi:glycosyltransferase involved in cell wall biosynthesis